MIFAVVGAAWLVVALGAGSLIGRCLSVTDRHDAERRDAEDRVVAALAPHPGELYVEDILRQRPAPSTS